MKVSTMAAPAPRIEQTFTTGSNIKPDVRAKVIAMIQGQNEAPAQVESKSPEHHSVDPNNISPEEISAVKSPSSEESEVKAQAESTQEEKQETKQPKQDTQLSKQFAQLARQEKILRQKAIQQEQQFKLREAELKAKELEIASQTGKIPQGYISLEDLKRNALGKLTEAGVSYDELTQQILNSAGVDPRTEALIAKQEARIAQLESKLDEAGKNQEKAQQDSYNAAVKQIREDVRSLVKHDPNFETIKASQAVDDVVELITETYNKDGILLSVEEAAQEVENYLVEEAMKLTRIGKIKSRLEQSGQKAKVEEKKQAQPQQTQQMKTLTNATSSTRKLSARERAVLAFKGELKQ